MIRTAVFARTAALLLACVAALPTATAAQVLRGIAVERESGARLELVRVTAASAEGASVSTHTDSAGLFTLRVPEAGTYTLTAELLGYRPVSMPDLLINAAEEITLEVALSISAVVLEPIRVTGRRAYGSAALQGYYERLEQYGRLGIGRFITRADIDRHTATQPSDYLRTVPYVTLPPSSLNPGARYPVFRMRGIRCTPQLYVDGMPLETENFDYVVSAGEIEGIELYRGRTEYPGDFFDVRGCGLILVWTRREAEPGGRPLTVRRLLLLGGFLAVSTLSMLLF